MLKGFNAAIFAYGATGSGKTHTMLGPCRKKNSSPITNNNSGPIQTYDLNGNGSENGLMVRAIEDIFQYTEMAEDPNSCTVRVVQSP